MKKMTFFKRWSLAKRFGDAMCYVADVDSA